MAWLSGLECLDCYETIMAQNRLVPFCCVLKKDTLWHFPLLGSFVKTSNSALNSNNSKNLK